MNKRHYRYDVIFCYLLVEMRMSSSLDREEKQMASLNKIMIIGNLGQDPELRYTSNQKAVATLNVATTESWVRDGQKQEHTEWHRIIVWDKQAENCAKYLSKGRPVYVEGRLQTRTWDDKNGQKRYSTEVIASTVQFLSASTGAKSATNNYATPEFSSAQQVDTNYFPQAKATPSYSVSQQQNDNPMDALDDIPF